MYFSFLTCLQILGGQEVDSLSLNYSLIASGSAFSRFPGSGRAAGYMFIALLLPAFSRAGSFIIWGVESSFVK